MLYNNNGIAQVTQLLQHLDKPFCIATVQTNTGFVEDIETAHQTASKRSGKIDTLALAARQAVGGAVECQIAQANIHQVLQPVFDFGKNTLGYLFLMLAEFEALYPGQQLADRNIHQIGDAAASYLHIVRLWS